MYAPKTDYPDTNRTDQSRLAPQIDDQQPPPAPVDLVLAQSPEPITKGFPFAPPFMLPAYRRRRLTH